MICILKFSGNLELWKYPELPLNINFFQKDNGNFERMHFSRTVGIYRNFLILYLILDIPTLDILLKINKLEIHNL